jgi:hypothetical protein
MNKQLQFTYTDEKTGISTDYTLEFTRKSVETMERNGFVASDINDKPMTVLPALFKGAFLANHRFVKDETVDAIFAKLTNKGELISKLSEMYNEPIMTLIDEPEESEGNVDWIASW